MDEKTPARARQLHARELRELLHVCGARTRSHGYCRNPPMRNGSGRCRLHGGASLRGPAHPNYTHGRYARRAR